MHTLQLIAGLSIAGVAAALPEQTGKIESCSWSPLVREHQVACAAPLTKQRPPTLLKVETPEFDERYAPPNTYKLPAPWKGPERCFTEFCLFSNPEAGEGMSLITTSRSAYVVATSKIPLSTGLEPTAFYEVEIPGKGVGLIANRTIRKGEIIMQRAPALLIQSIPHIDLEPELRLETYHAAVDRLPEVTRDRFLGQIGNNIYDKVEKNSFRIFVDGDKKHSAHLGIFPEVSKFNHDCRPNVHYRLSNLTHTTVAVRDIPAGEELTVSYIYGRTPRSERQAQLSEWGFTCACSQCTLPDIESRASDIRLRQIKELETEIERLMSRGGGGSGGGMRPEMGGKLVELYLAERLDAYLAPTYTRAALIYSMFGHEEKASEYAREAAGALERETGPQATDIESMKRLAGDPKGHWSWGVMATSGKGNGGRNETEAKGK